MRKTLIGALSVLAFAVPATAQEVALTFDDLPAHAPLPPGETRIGVIGRLVAALADAGAVPAMGFVNASRLEEEPADRAVLEIWRDAGHQLGNHGWAHANLDEIGAEAFEAELVRNEPVLEAMADGSDWRWFRYPFLAEGRDPAVRRAGREVLREHGYKVASVTMDFSDWAYNNTYERCRKTGDAAAVARMETLFLAGADEALAASRALSDRLYGRDIPYVLLMHAGAFDARMMPRLLELYQARGVTFVSLEAAMSDPFYETDREAADTAAPLTLENEARAAGIAVPERADVLNELAALCT
ncbi:MAG: polysaccharide deacetylase family protein [Alphaproteobacteria bacterium]|nr:polysaccharide deacetylase family protein [Alphaproteobacteria bacterium]MBU2380147.1 polysaccharide deacetylase family protein [Alphaproteobacteria bacterium]